MLIEFKLPELGENIENADIIGVLIKKGDKVEKDQALFEIETDKATVEVPSDVEGIVKEIRIKEGEKASVGQTLLTLESEGSASVEKKEGESEDTGKEETEPAKAERTESENEEIREVKSEDAPGSKSAGEIYEFKLPDLGENIESADITKVLVSKGDKIVTDQVVIEIETDKAAVEVPSEVSGSVKEVFVKDGDNAKVGDVLFTLETVGKTVEADKAPAPEVKTEKKTAHEIKKDQEKKEVKSETPAMIWQKRDMPEKIAPAAPSVRRFAREIGIDIHTVKGNGPGGRISTEDVKAHAKHLNENLARTGAAPAAFGIPSEPLPDFSKWGEIEVEPMSNIRRKTAEHLSFAWSTIPHVTQFDNADITELESIRKKFSKKAESYGGKLTITAILLKITASALKVFPQFNSSIDMVNKGIIYKKYFNIGVAVDTDRGLLVPVIRDVDKKNIFQLSAELSEMSRKARDKKLSLEEMQGGNFSISNLGGIGGTYFTPIVNSPEVAILGVSRGGFQPVYTDGKFEPRLILPLSLSYDHRIIDGADAARFLRWVVEALENPILLSLEG